MVLEAATVDRMLGSWATEVQDPNEQFNTSGGISGSRGEWLYDNDPLGHAITETILRSTIGNGLTWHSAFQAPGESDDALTEAEKAVRRKARRSVDRATRGTRFDAAGRMVRADMSRVILASALLTGSGWSVKQWRPNRPGRQVQATCWRIVHSSRVCNPNFGSNTDRLINGVAVDDGGSPLGIHVMTSHPNNFHASERFKWNFVPWYDQNGHPQITHQTLPRHPDQIRAPSWFTSVIPLLRMFGATLSAKVVADRLKASMGLICECDDPVEFARKDRNGAVLNGNTKIVPGKTYYVAKGTIWKTLDFQYNGQDFKNWADCLLELVCAPFGVSSDFVLQRFGQTSLAASRVGLIQAYQTFHGIQNWQIGYTEDTWNQSVLIEDLARGDLTLDGDDEVEAMDRLLTGAYQRPARPMPDPLKEAQTADHWTKRLGRSYSAVYNDAGIDLATNNVVRAQDEADFKRHGIILAGDPKTDPMANGMAGRPAPASAPNQTTAKDDTKGDDKNDDKNDEGAPTGAEQGEPVGAGI